MHPDFDMKPIGLTTDRNSLRKLLRFVSGKVPENWRIDVDIIEDTMFFTRWEESKFQIIAGRFQSGYGHEFEKAFLRYDSKLQESSGHHRIVRYNLGGVECLVRFEVDGYVGNGFGDDDELTQALSGLQVQSPENLFALNPASEVKVIQRGRLVNNQTILELKSRSSTNIKMNEIIPQLWISQTHNLFVGRHKEGLVEAEPERFHMDEKFPNWEVANQEHLRTLVTLITEIRNVAKGIKGGQCMLVCKQEEKPRVLRVYKRNGAAFFLPKGVREVCWGSNDKTPETPA